MSSYMQTTCLLVLVTTVVHCYILRRSCLQHANFSYIRENAVLQGSVIRTLMNKSPEECETECIGEYLCKSINLENADQRACELNRDSEADIADGKTLTKKTGWTFKSTDYRDLLVGGYCNLMKPCPPDHLCMDSCHCPGFECIKCNSISSCISPIKITGEALGMEDGRILDKYITSSSINRLGESASKGRLNKLTRYVAPFPDIPQFLRVEFPSRMIITDIAVQGHHNWDGWVKNYQLSYTEDQQIWKQYKENGTTKIFTGSSSRNGVVKQSVRLIRAYSIAIIPTAWHNTICLRMEVYGQEDFFQPGLSTIYGTALGLESGAIKDYQISASSHERPGEGAQFARLNGPSRWCALSSAFEGSFLRVDFDTRKIITAIAIQSYTSGSNLNLSVKKFQLMYTEDGYIWKKHLEIGFIETLSALNQYTFEAILKKRLLPRIRLFSIKLLPTEWHGHVCMRMELYGLEDPEQPVKPSGCSNNERPLGMASGAITDSQITASSTYGHGFATKYARLNALATWCSSQKNANQFIQVDLGRIMKVTAFATQGRYNHNGWPASFRISYKTAMMAQYVDVTNGGTFQEFPGNTDRFGIVKHRLEPALDAQFIRIIVLTTNPAGDYACLRAELYGCDLII